VRRNPGRLRGRTGVQSEGVLTPQYSAVTTTGRQVRYSEHHATSISDRGHASIFYLFVCQGGKIETARTITAVNCTALYQSTQMINEAALSRLGYADDQNYLIQN
jgi:hypothetical protein